MTLAYYRCLHSRILLSKLFHNFYYMSYTEALVLFILLQTHKILIRPLSHMEFKTILFILAYFNPCLVCFCFTVVKCLLVSKNRKIYVSESFDKCMHVGCVCLVFSVVRISCDVRGYWNNTQPVLLCWY